MATPLPPNVHVMKGGFQAQVGDLYHKYEQPLVALAGLFMVLIIVFLDKVPVEIRKQADSFLGRVLLLTFTVVVTTLYGWPMGILAGLMSALLIGAGGIHPIRKQVNEGFMSEMNVRLVPGEHKWFVERVLGENPLIIEDDVVRTSAVQDLSEKYTGSVQSTSVTR